MDWPKIVQKFQMDPDYLKKKIAGSRGEVMKSSVGVVRWCRDGVVVGLVIVKVRWHGNSQFP